MASGWTVISIEPVYYEQAHHMQCEYLDRESYEEFRRRIAIDPGLYWVALDVDTVIGVCYGEVSRRNKSQATLQGIAVNLDTSKSYARHGIGSQLMAHFEQAAIKCGLLAVSLGSAEDDKVEKFYLKNGYMPIELVAKNDYYEELERVSVTDYESGLRIREQLRAKYRAREVIFIFEKTLNGPLL